MKKIISIAMMMLMIVFQMTLPTVVFAQNSVDSFDQFEELEVDRPASSLSNSPTNSLNKRKGSRVDDELRIQKKILQRKKDGETAVDSNPNTDRFPKPDPIFKKPPGPKEGGSVRVEHPSAAEGLIRINKDGSYQYRTKLAEKTQSGSFRIGQLTAPRIYAQSNAITYQSMYGDENLFMLSFDYEWQPFHSFGSLGFGLGTGFATSTAKGTFKTGGFNRPARSEESYNLFIIPATAFLTYRFEYMRRQWIVPFITGGATYFGLAEVRDDGTSPSFAGAPALGGGGGLMISISRMDAASAFTMSQEYGVADMWLVLEAKVLQGLSEETDFSSDLISAGISVDF